MVVGDPTRLAQILGNLLGNAAKVTPRDGRVSLSLTASSASGMAEIRVRDTGVGIPPMMLAKIFDPFTQGDRSLERGAGGLGLGLALVRALVRMHHGDVRVVSDVGTGSEFIVRLPVHAGVAAAASPRPGVTAGASARKVLIVEDNADLADMLREVLLAEGHEVEIARTGSQGIAAAEAHEPDVVICDIGLPGLDGYEVARALRARASSRLSRLIALSGYGQPEDRERSLAAGFDLHLTKPVDPDTLARLLE